LRDYGKDVEAIWGGDINCQHEWEIERTARPNSSGGKTEWAKEKLAIKGVDNYSEYTDYNDRATYTNFCKKCGAWKGQLGLEPTPELYVQHIVEVFREVKRVLKKEGTLWLDLGDSYSGSNSDKYSVIDPDSLSAKAGHTLGGVSKGRGVVDGLKPKDLVGIPWRVAFALQADGWYLRQDIIWHKPNPMPESVEDRCTKSHEYVFLLAKSQYYFFNNEAIKETATGYDGRKDTFLKGSEKYANGFVPNQSAQTIAARGHERWQKRKNDGTNYGGDGTGFQDHSGYSNLENPYVRNKRSVWTVATKPYSGAHFATFPEALIVPMIKAGCPEFICKKCGKARETIRQPVGEKLDVEAGVVTDESKPYAVVEREGYIEVRDLPPIMEIKLYLNLWRKKAGYTIEQVEEIMQSQAPHHWFNGESYPTKEQWIEAKELFKFDDTYDFRMTDITLKNAEKLKGEYKTVLTDCGCNAEFEPGIVMDPFSGAGTACMVAKKLWRRYLGIEQNPEYVKMAENRIEIECGTLF
jgi:DNA modification methylase